MGRFAHLHHFFLAKRQAQGDVVFYGVFKNFGLLGEKGDVIGKHLQSVVIFAIRNQLQAWFRWVQAPHQGQQGAFATTTFTNQCDTFASFDLDVQVI